MKSNKYIVVTVCENGRYYAYARKAEGSEPDAMSKDHAYQVVEMWRAMYKVNGVYMFDGPESPRF